MSTLITLFLKTMNFSEFEDDPCIYYNNNRSIIALFVVDGLIAGNDRN